MVARRRKYKRKKNTGKGLFILFFLILVAGGLYVYKKKILDKNTQKVEHVKVRTSGGIIQRVENNYGKEVDKLAKEFNLPAHYLKALIALECSGLKPAKTRFEKHVFKRLKRLKQGKISSYENVKRRHVNELGDGGLKNLATSWGPFQLMGYKCIILGIYVRDVRGKDALYWGVKWIDMTYGSYLRKGKFKDAFHIHNTGRPFPKNGKPRTYDPKYVYKGIAYMEKFSN